MWGAHAAVVLPQTVHGLAAVPLGVALVLLRLLRQVPLRLLRRMSSRLLRRVLRLRQAVVRVAPRVVRRVLLRQVRQRVLVWRAVVPRVLRQAVLRWPVPRRVHPVTSPQSHVGRPPGGGP